MGEAGESEGMVNPEKWKGFVKDLELMGKAKSVIIGNLGRNLDGEQVSKTIKEIYAGHEQDADGLQEAVKIFTGYKVAVEREWERFTGTPGTVGEKAGGESGAGFYTELMGEKPRGEVLLERTDITINLRPENDEDFLDLIKRILTGVTSSFPLFTWTR